MWNPFRRRPKLTAAVEEQRRNNGDDAENAAPEPAPKKPGGCTGKGFKPGQSGNPGGRPKGTSITAALRELLDDAGPDSVAGPLLIAAQTGDMKAIKVVLDRTEGRVQDRVQVDHDGTVTVRVEYADRLPGAAEAPCGPAPRDEGSEAIQRPGDGPALGQDDARDRPAD